MLNGTCIQGEFIFLELVWLQHRKSLAVQFSKTIRDARFFKAMGKVFILV